MIKRPIQPRLIVTFSTTAAAFQMEACAREQGFAGRLIPIPRAIHAGCGLAWQDAPDRETALRNMMAQAGIVYEQLCVLLL